MTAGMVQGGPGATQAAAGRAVLELHLGELRQLFNSMDPAPFRESDLADEAEAYNRITSSVHDGEIMLLHAVSKSNADILGRVIDDIEKEGYTFTIEL